MSKELNTRSYLSCVVSDDGDNDDGRYQQPEDADSSPPHPGPGVPLIRLHGAGLLPRPPAQGGQALALLRQVQDAAPSQQGWSFMSKTVKK